MKYDIKNSYKMTSETSCGGMANGSSVDSLVKVFTRMFTFGW